MEVLIGIMEVFFVWCRGICKKKKKNV